MLGDGGESPGSRLGEKGFMSHSGAMVGLGFPSALPSCPYSGLVWILESPAHSISLQNL